MTSAEGPYKHKSSSLKNIDIHIDDKNFSQEQQSQNQQQNQQNCTWCDLKFNSKDELEDHIGLDHSLSSNSQEKQLYPCNKCLYIFDSEKKYADHLTGTEHNLKKVDDYSEDSEDEDYSDKCRHCGKVFTTYESFDNHQDSYLQCDQCKVCFHNEFQWDEHENCKRYA